MGKTKRKEDKGGEKAQKRKRRRKARTDVSSDSDSDSSSDEVQIPKEKDVEMEDASMPAAPVVEDDEDDDEQEANEQEPAGKFTEKGGRIPSPLRDFHDPQAEVKFEEYYMRLITEEFGDDLNNVREAKDFGDNSLPMLIRALRQGVNIFDSGEKRAVVKEMA